MPLPTSIHAYADVAITLEQLKAAGGGTLTFESKSDAGRWRQRAYMYRKVLSEQERKRHSAPAGVTPPTPYDEMTISQRGEKLDLVFEFIGSPLSITDLEGNELQPNKPQPKQEPQTELSGELAALVEKHR